VTAAVVPVTLWHNDQDDSDETLTFRLLLGDRMRLRCPEFDAAIPAMPLMDEPKYPRRRAYALEARGDATPLRLLAISRTRSAEFSLSRVGQLTRSSAGIKQISKVMEATGRSGTGQHPS
jgi:hypothetical protein